VDAAGDRVPVAAAEAVGRQNTRMMQATITPQAAVAEEHAPNLQDNRLSNPQGIKAAAVATDPNLFPRL
jgi:hypothetical protein